jgi:aminoglycoside 6-adenylyltransferase
MEQQCDASDGGRTHAAEPEEPRLAHDVLERITRWARGNDLVRAVVLGGSRADPNADIDDLSDYDIELYVSDRMPFEHDDVWLEPFGPILVRWPATPRSTFDEAWITRLVLFHDGVRIDFQITENRSVDPDTHRNGYRVLVDKDGLTDGLPKPTHDRYVIEQPTQDAFERIAAEFWWNVTYVPKYLVRDELPFAKFMLDGVLRSSYLHPMIEWSIGARNDWSVATGVQGRFFKRYLDGPTWAELEATYAGAGIAENVDAFRRMIELFRRLAVDLAERLGHSYPNELDRDVWAYCERLLEGLPGS